MSLQEAPEPSDIQKPILGAIPVIASLNLGSEQLTLVLTRTSLIVAHVGKRGVGAMATVSLLGKLSAGLEDLFKSGRESSKKKRIVQQSPLEILESDKDNFQIDYGDIIRVELEQYPQTIMILTKDNKYDFSNLAEYETAVKIFREAIGDKLTLTG